MAGGSHSPAVAFLVIGHAAPECLGRLCSQVHDYDIDVFLHLDARTDSVAYLAQVGPEAERLRLTPERQPIFWGGFHMVEAASALIRLAMAHRPYRTLVLLPEDCGLLQSPDRVKRELLRQPIRIGQEMGPFFPRLPRYEHTYVLDAPFASARELPVEERAVDVEAFLAIAADLERLRQLGKTEIPFLYTGSQWWALEGALALELAEQLALDEQLRLSFRYSAIPDEIYFQTMVGLRGLLEPCPANPFPSPMLTDFSRDPKPYVFRELEEIREAHRQRHHPALFVRKLDPGLLPRLPELWQESLATTPPEQPEALSHEKGGEA
jgi:hypothetical protein